MRARPREEAFLHYFDRSIDRSIAFFLYRLPSLFRSASRETPDEWRRRLSTSLSIRSPSAVSCSPRDDCKQMTSTYRVNPRIENQARVMQNNAMSSQARVFFMGYSITRLMEDTVPYQCVCDSKCREPPIPAQYFFHPSHKHHVLHRIGYHLSQFRLFILQLDFLCFFGFFGLF